MLICYICLSIFATIPAEQNIIQKKDKEYYFYEANTNDPISHYYLPSRGVPEDDNPSSFKLYEINKKYQVPQFSNSDSPPSVHIGQHQPLIYGNPLLAALLLSNIFGTPPLKYQGFNHPDQTPVNPYITLLLSQYGRYLPIHALGTKGLYYYGASNNYHNNKPFGSYKVNEEAK